MERAKFAVFNSIILLFFIGLLNSINKNSIKPSITITNQDKAINFSSNFYEIFSLGNKPLINSILWITTLMESDLDHYKSKDLNSWMFLRFKSITDLNPYFFEAYRYGGLYLSVIKDDIPGASYIYDRGLKLFSDHFHFAYYAGLHFYFEEGDHKKSYGILKNIIDHPQAPKFLPTLAAKIGIKNNSVLSLDEAFAVILDAYKKSPNDSAIKNKFFRDLYAIRAEIDLGCLNTQQITCRKIDFKGRPYIKIDGQYKAADDWKKFKLNKK